jgi:hypothetical protein
MSDYEPVGPFKLRAGVKHIDGQINYHVIDSRERKVAEIKATPSTATYIITGLNREWALMSGPARRAR